MTRAVLLSAMLAVAVLACGVAADSYDESIAKRAVYYSAAAYSDDPAGCISSMYALSEVTKFSGKDSGGNPIFGFSAVNADTQEVVVAFRGTAGSYQLFLEIVSASKFEPFDPSAPGAQVVSYFSSAAEQLSDQFTDAIIKLAVAYPGYPLLFTGHSLGAALTSLASVAMTNTFKGMSPALNPKVLLYTFGQPRVGNFDYSSLHDSLGITSFRVIHNRDIVAHVPPCAESDFKCKQVPGSDDAYHHGTEVFYPDFNSAGKLCTGAPVDEDASCSNSQIDLSIDDHLVYFGIHVGDYCSSGLELPVNSPAELPNNA